MTQQTTADELEEVAVAATGTATDVGRETTERVVAGVREVGAKVESLATETQKALGANVEDFSKRVQTLSAFNQQTLDALARSPEIAAKAFEGIGREVAAYTKTAFEERVAAAQDLATAKTVTELLEKQTAFARNAFEGWVHQATKMNEICTAAAKDIAAPIGQRFSAAVEEAKA